VCSAQLRVGFDTAGSPKRVDDVERKAETAAQHNHLNAIELTS